MLWAEGETSGMLVAIDRGRVKIYRLLPTGRAITLYLFGPNDVFGFLPFLDGLPYPAHAQAIDDVDARVMARPELLAALRAEPELAGALVEFLGRRLRSAFELILGLSAPGARVRVASALLQLIPENAEQTIPISIKLPVSAHELAGVIGVAPETFSRAITSLVEDGVLNRESKGRYRVLDLENLRASAEPVG